MYDIVIVAGHAEETQETAGWVPELARSESAFRAHVHPRDGVPAPEDHAVAELVRGAPSVRSRSRAAATAPAAAGRGRRPDHAAVQDAHLHGPVQISGRRRVQATNPGSGRESSSAVAVVVVRISRERILLETVTRYAYNLSHPIS